MNWFTKSRDFLREVLAELKKVTFPSREEVMGTTVVVIITSIIFAAYLWLADQAIQGVYRGIHRVFGV
jgi:preprotein translocase subunit SecE